jgi:AcrR family transcriptional regulator
MPAPGRLAPRKTPRQERARHTVAAILTGAAQVFERRGYAAGTTDRIAERAGVSVGSLYQYFPNKDSILVTLAERHMDGGVAVIRRLLEEVRAEAESGPVDLESVLRRFVETMVRLHRYEPNLNRVLFEETPLPAGVRRRLEQLERGLADEVKGLLDRVPSVDVPDTALAAYLLVQAVDNLVHGFILHPPPEIEPDRFVDDLVRMLSRYLTRC